MLIAFEGLDQSGKETQARTCRARLANEGRNVRALSFPDYHTPIGEEIGKALAGERDFAADVMQLLYVANRFEFKARLDLWLSAGDVVVCDRYRASSVAYGEAQGLDRAWLRRIQEPLPPATVTVLLDISPDTAVRRKQAGRDKYERDTALLTRVRASYLNQAQEDDWVVINAEASKDEVAEAVARAVWPRLVPPSPPSRS
jgi:dTMP kinase